MSDQWDKFITPKPGNAEKCIKERHRIDRHLIYDGKVEATCRCLDCMRDWQEFYKLERTEE